MRDGRGEDVNERAALWSIRAEAQEVGGRPDHVDGVLADEVVRGHILVETREVVAEVHLELTGFDPLGELVGSVEQIDEFFSHVPPHFWWGWVWSTAGTNVSLMERELVQRIRFCGAPALSLVPEARPPPNGC